MCADSLRQCGISRLKNDTQVSLNVTDTFVIHLHSILFRAGKIELFRLAFVSCLSKYASKKENAAEHPSPKILRLCDRSYCGYIVDSVEGEVNG
jgi:hypothetical protein